MTEQTILIAEDDPDIRDGVRILLAGEGYHILEAENGLRALELYRGQTLVYSSFAPKGGIPEKTERDPGDRVAFYEWSPGYTLNFADGEAEALLYYNGLNDYYSTGCDILNMLCLLWWFPGFFLFNSRKIIRYILQLSEEIQAMEDGDLEHPITVRGHDELTTLASCLDSMRLTLRQQQEEEAQASAKVKSLITEMSHDLRTPLTTLLLYTEILRGHKYDTPEQEADYLNKIDAKAFPFGGRLSFTNYFPHLKQS